MNALCRLAQAHGIGLRYHDIWGALHDVPADTIRGLLRTMSVSASTDEEVQAALEAHERAIWRRRIAPMVVLREDVSPSRVRLHLPCSVGTDPMQIRIVTETGDEHQRSMSPPMAVAHALVDGEPWCALDVELPLALAAGYHRVTFAAGDQIVAHAHVAVTPARCHRPVALLDGTRAWGTAVQLYGVRSPRNWGIGDFTDLGEIVAQCGARGAGIVGVNPLHALFPHEPRHISPYSPSSRLFANPLYLDVEAIADFAECEPARALLADPAFAKRLVALRDTWLVDYPGVAAAKREVLDLLYASFRDRHRHRRTSRAASFTAFRREAGEALRQHALFEAMQEHFFAQDASVWGWPVWPGPFRDPHSPDVARFAQEHGERVDYYAYLQWQVDLQRAAIAKRADEAGLSIGLYTDLAVSVDPGGAEAWANQTLYAAAASVGAPPDAFNPDGQDWGLPPIVPSRLRAAGYAPFIATLRANMRHAGALRIDHVMGLMRLFWVPRGRTPAEGAYVHYPFDDLVGLVALESQRHRCLVIGEDLGTVPDSVRRTLAERDILSYRVLMFERDGAGDFKPPEAYPEAALATASTHDLPTLAGWWEGHDIEVRAKLGMLGAEAARLQEERAEDRRRLLRALERAGVLQDDPISATLSTPKLTAALVESIAAFLAATPSLIAVLQLEDVVLAREQANLPGTVDAHPNWRRKLPVTIDALDGEPFRSLARRLSQVRPPPARPTSARRILAAKRDHRRGSDARSRVRTELVALLPGSIPRATYRVQLHRDFRFTDATALVPYLATLGISHLYCSPYLRARPGSRHGYDIVDHTMLNPEIGTTADFDTMVDALARHGMSHLCDVVPNHMAIMGHDNAWWMDVLENGPASSYAAFFDIDWHPQDPDLAGKVLVPILGDPYGAVLERGELVLGFERGTGTFAVRYHEHRLPLDPRECASIVELALAAVTERLPAYVIAEGESVVNGLRTLPARSEDAPERIAARRRDAPLCKRRLAQLAASHALVAEAIDTIVHRFNGSPGVSQSFDPLGTLLDDQSFRLAYWRVASDEINYRRFFDINDLASLRMEDESVFEATHRYLLDLAANGSIGGLRIDHPDGLHDPAAYFTRLQRRYRELATQRSRGTPDEGSGIYIALEKISASHEHLPAQWPVHGDTGYRFANDIHAVLVDPTARRRVDRVWRNFVGEAARDFETAAYEGKRGIMRGSLAAGLSGLASHALKIARADRRTRDFTFNALREALAESVAWFPVYRTYVSAEGVSAQDRRYIDWAVSRARRATRFADPTIFDFVRALLLASPPADAPRSTVQRYLGFAMRFQQYTSPVAAKGVEDTSFYTHTRLLSGNDVGSDPDAFGMTRRAFHRTNANRAATWPHTILATSTHDNKRSEDVRARIAVISEMPAAWRLTVRRWSRMNRSRKQAIDERIAPSPNDEYLLYQTLVGSFPPGNTHTSSLEAYRERIASYMIKAAREAKLRTSWLHVDADYEQALTAFVGALLADHADNRFLDDLRTQVAVFAWFGLLNSLTMTLVKLASPGVPDFYQGNELLDYSLVDPDNRRPVDYALRRALLDSLQRLEADTARSPGERMRDLFASAYDGRAKLWIVHRMLRFRERNRALFDAGTYVPLTANGSRSRHVLAFARLHGQHGLVAIAGRLFASMGLGVGDVPLGSSAWGDTVLEGKVVPTGTVVTEVLSGATFRSEDNAWPLARLFEHFPGAVLAW